uniref:TORC_M domain-containing protein n=1 Tax=Mesocestoides corti TaxID=53468 RepID=A0A5K3G3T1_MESCO
MMQTGCPTPLVVSGGDTLLPHTPGTTFIPHIPGSFIFGFLPPSTPSVDDSQPSPSQSPSSVLGGTMTQRGGPTSLPPPPSHNEEHPSPAAMSSSSPYQHQQDTSVNAFLSTTPDLVSLFYWLISDAWVICPCK